MNFLQRFELYEYLKGLANETGITVWTPTQLDGPSRGRPFMRINNDIVIIDYPDHLRPTDGNDNQ